MPIVNYFYENLSLSAGFTNLEMQKGKSRLDILKPSFLKVELKSN